MISITNFLNSSVKTSATIYLTTELPMGDTGTRQADAHKFAGIYAFETLRRFIGDAAAEEFLLVEYRLQRNEPGLSDIVGNDPNLFERDQVHCELEFSPGCRS